MEIETICSNCGDTLIAEDSMIGLTMDCPMCGNSFEVQPRRKKQPVIPKKESLADKKSNPVKAILTLIIALAGAFYVYSYVYFDSNKRIVDSFLKTMNQGEPLTITLDSKYSDSIIDSQFYSVDSWKIIKSEETTHNTSASSLDELIKLDSEDAHIVSVKGIAKTPLGERKRNFSFILKNGAIIDSQRFVVPNKYSDPLLSDLQNINRLTEITKNLKVEDLFWTIKDGYVRGHANLVNHSDSAVNFVKVNIKCLDGKNVINSDSIYVNGSDALLPKEKKPFEIFIRARELVYDLQYTVSID